MKIKLAAPQFIYEIGKRANQEDYIYPAPGEANADSRVFIVCDGMGGHEKGEVASKTVCETLAQAINSMISDDTIFDEEMLEKAIEQAYKQLDEKDNGAAKKMGTTLTMLVFHKGGCFMAHMGDSRIYHIRPAQKKILYMSRDHSLVFDLFRSGEITFEQMQSHPKKNIITRAMMPGEENRLSADGVNTTDIQPGDYFYLCTDGMLEQMEEDDIAGILSSDNTDAVKQQRLISATLDNKDNHSAYLLRVENVLAEEGDDTLRNDELSSRSNVSNYVNLNAKEAIHVKTGNFKADAPGEETEKKKFPWVKIMLALIAISFIGLFIVVPGLKEQKNKDVTVEKKTIKSTDEYNDFDEKTYGEEKRDSIQAAIQRQDSINKVMKKYQEANAAKQASQPKPANSESKRKEQPKNSESRKDQPRNEQPEQPARNEESHSANAGSNTNAAGQQNATPQPTQPAASTAQPAPATPQQQPQQAQPAKPVVAQPQNQGGLDADFQ